MYSIWEKGVKEDKSLLEFTREAENAIKRAT